MRESLPALAVATPCGAGGGVVVVSFTRLAGAAAAVTVTTFIVVAIVFVFLLFVRSYEREPVRSFGPGIDDAYGITCHGGGIETCVSLPPAHYTSHRASFNKSVHR